MSSRFDISGKKCIVTGASRGIGKALAKGLAEEGCEVVCIARKSERLTETVKELTDMGCKAYAVGADFSERDQTIRAFDEALEILGGQLDVLVPCAAIQGRHLPEEFPLDEFDRILEVNIMHVVAMCQKAIRVMLKQKTGGKIITIASLGSYVAGTCISPYSASKGAIAMYTKSLAVDCAGRGINVNAIAPGYTMTEILADLPEERKKEIGEYVPQKRWGQPEDMVGLCIFLASEASSYMNGAIIPVDGGYLAKL